MTERSGNEIQAMVLRAGRGAGWPLANAQDIALACRWLGGDLRPVVDAMTEGANPDGVAYAGPAMIDLALAHRGQAHALPGDMGPSVLFRALCDAASVQHGCAIVVDTSSPIGTVTAEAGPPTKAPARARAVVDESDWAALSHFAAQTYVPESDASRLSGAGAGLTDND